MSRPAMLIPRRRPRRVVIVSSPDRVSPPNGPITHLPPRSATRCRRIDRRRSRRQDNLRTGATTRPGLRPRRRHRLADVVNLPPPVDIFVRLLVLGQHEPRSQIQTVVHADHARDAVLVLVAVQVVVVVVAAGNHGSGSSRRYRMPTAALQILVVFVVQRQRSVQVELPLQVVGLPLQIGQNAVHLLQHFGIDPVGGSQLLPWITRRGRVRIVRTQRDVVHLVVFVVVLVDQRDAAVVGVRGRPAAVDRLLGLGRFHRIVRVAVATAVVVDQIAVARAVHRSLRKVSCFETR